MVRKGGYFSITDACIKHCRANFLIARAKKKHSSGAILRELGGRGGVRVTRGRPRSRPGGARVGDKPACGLVPAMLRCRGVGSHDLTGRRGAAARGSSSGTWLGPGCPAGGDESSRPAALAAWSLQ